MIVLKGHNLFANNVDTLNQFTCLGNSLENVQRESANDVMRRESEFPTPYEFVEYLLDEIPSMGDVKNVNRHFAAQYTQYYFHTQFS